MKDTSDSASVLPWLWVIEALAGLKEVDTSTLLDLIDIAPMQPDGFGKNTRELIALRFLEALVKYAGSIDSNASSTLNLKAGFDYSQSCEDVLLRILQEIPLANPRMAAAKLGKWDLHPFIVHKRATTINCDLEKMKESILEGTHTYTDYIKECSGLELVNTGCPVPTSDGKYIALSRKGNVICTYAENMGAKEISISSVQGDGNKSCEDDLENKKLQRSKRSRIDSDDQNVMGYLQENQVGKIDSEDFLRNKKKIKCHASSSFESIKEKPESQDGRALLDNSSEKVLVVSEGEGHPREKDQVDTSGGDLVVEDSLDYQSDDEVCHDQSGVLGANTVPPNTSEGVLYQHHVESIPTNVALPDEIHHKNSDNKPRSENGVDFQLKEPNGQSTNGTEPPVAGDEAVTGTGNGCGAEMSSDSDGCHNEEIDLTAKKHLFLSSLYAPSHDFSMSCEWTEQHLCMKCNEGGQLLVCKMTTCPVVVHESCLRFKARLDDEGNFLCPFCAYSLAVSEYLEAKKKASLARKELTIFISVGRQATEPVDVFHGKDIPSKRGKHEHRHIKNKGNGQLQLTENNTQDHGSDHLNKADNNGFEKSQQQAEPSALCVNAVSSCREMENVNNGSLKECAGNEGGGMVNAESSTVQALEENQVPADYADIADKFPSEKSDVVSANQISKREGSQWKLPRQTNNDQIKEPACADDTEEEEISEGGAISAYSLRYRKQKTQVMPQARITVRRKKVPWSSEEEKILREGMKKFANAAIKERNGIPWKEIFAFGCGVFKEGRTARDLKDKWRNMCGRRR